MASSVSLVYATNQQQGSGKSLGNETKLLDDEQFLSNATRHHPDGMNAPTRASKLDPGHKPLRGHAAHALPDKAPGEAE